MSGARQLRAGVVGVGAIGSLHARAYAEHPRTALVAVADADLARAEAVGRELGVPGYEDWRELLEREQLDLVSVATPEGARYEPASACARSGTHLLLEKPLAPTLEESRRLVQEVRASGVVATVNFILRSDPRYLRARQAVADGSLGEPCTIFARRRGTSAGAEVYAPWTGLLISTAIHDLDAMAWIVGAPVERVHGEAVVKRCGQWGTQDGVVAVLRFANGAVGSLETSWILPRTVPAPLDASLHLVGTAGGVFIDGSNHGLAVATEDGFTLPDLTHWPIGRAGVEGDLAAAVDAFVRSVADGDPPPITLEEALYAHELVAAVEESLATGRPVHFVQPNPND